MRRASRRVERRLAMKRRAYLNKMRRTAREPVMEGKELQLFRAMDEAKGKDKKGALKAFIKYKINEDPDIVEKLGRYFEKANLSGKDDFLNHTDFSSVKKISLHRTNFKDVILKRCNFNGLDLTRANFEGAKLNGSQFVGSDLRAANLNNACLTEVNFTGAKLGNANISNSDGIKNVIFNGADMRGVWIEDGIVDSCKFVGVQEILSVEGTTFMGATSLVGILFSHCSALSDCKFTGATDLSRITYSGTFGDLPELDNVVFEGATLSGCTAEAGSFVSTNFDRATMTGCKLAGGDFSNAKMRGTILTGADLSDGSAFEGADLTGADLREANLEGAIFEGALSLRGVKLHGAKLIDAELQGVDLNGAVLDGADLSGADLTGVDLSNVSLKNITTDNNTKMDMSFGRKLRKFITRRASDENPTAHRRVASRFVEGLYAEEVESNEDEILGYDMDDHMGYDMDDHMGYDMDDHMGYEDDLLDYEDEF